MEHQEVKEREAGPKKRRKSGKEKEVPFHKPPSAKWNKTRQIRILSPNRHKNRNIKHCPPNTINTTRKLHFLDSATRWGINRQGQQSFGDLVAKDTNANLRWNIGPRRQKVPMGLFHALFSYSHVHASENWCLKFYPWVWSCNWKVP